MAHEHSKRMDNSASVILGTMTWGQSSGQVKYDDAVKQIEYMLEYQSATFTRTGGKVEDNGCIILDTARM